MALHQLTGYVIERDDFFVMARGVKRDAPWEAIRCPHVSFSREVQDAWFIYGFAGDLRALVEAVPYFLPWMGWARRSGKVRWYKSEKFIGRVVPRRT
jgi:hypothetical protein